MAAVGAWLRRRIGARRSKSGVSAALKTNQSLKKPDINWRILAAGVTWRNAGIGGNPRQ